MAVLVFECPLDDQTLESLRELREIRLEVLRQQALDIDATMNRLQTQGALSEDERPLYREAIIEDINAKVVVLEDRMQMGEETVYYDEIELYIDLLSS